MEQARVKLIYFASISQLEKDEDGKKKVGLAASVRDAFTTFMHDIMVRQRRLDFGSILRVCKHMFWEQGNRSPGASAKPRMLGAIAAFYFALVCGVSVLAMLAPGGTSLVVAWSAIGLTSVAGWLTVRFQSQKSADTKKPGAADTTADIIWSNFSVIRAIWASMLLLVLVPATMMTLPEKLARQFDAEGGPPKMAAQSGGLFFLFVLWSLGWCFLWLQDQGGGVLARCDTFLMSTSGSTHVRRQVLEHCDATEADGETPLMVPQAGRPIHIKGRDGKEQSEWRKIFPHRCSWTVDRWSCVKLRRWRRSLRKAEIGSALFCGLST